MSTEAALLRAIRDLPDEDTPRLMYADVLDEDGFAARAEFIRVQVERSQLPETDPRRRALEDREHELLSAHEPEWIGVAADDQDELIEWEFRRGFIEEVAASPVFMRDAGADLCATHPVRRWRVMSGDRGNNLPADLLEAGRRGWFARLEAVELRSWYADLGEISGFLARAQFDRLRELDLYGRGPLEPLPEILEFAPFRDRLKVLRCGAGGYEGGRLDAVEFVRAMGSVCRLDKFGALGALLMADDVRDLLAAPVFSALTSLDLQSNQIDPGGWEAFRTARFRLRELDLSATPLGETSLDRLLDCVSLRELRSLHLNNCQHTPANVAALAASPFWSRAEELRMHLMVWAGPHEGEVEPEEPGPTSLDPLFDSTGSNNLRVLDLAGNRLRDAGVARLSEAAWTGSLTYLDLSNNYLSDEALRTIASSGRFKNLRTLHLNFNSPYEQRGATVAITDAGLRALAHCPDLANLRVLSISGTRITAAGVEAVLNSPHWRLSGLMLAQCQLRPDVVRVLTSPRLARLEVLDLSENDELDVEDLAPLAESEYLSPQTELDLRGLGGRRPSALYPFRVRLGRRLSV